MPLDRPRAALVLTAALVAACGHAALPRDERVEAHTAPTTLTPATAAPAVVASAAATSLPPERPRWPPAPPAIKSAFCLDGVLDTLAEDACYVLPDAPTKTLLVYLPGLMPPTAESPEKRAVETVVANAARRAGIAALVPRGDSRDALAAPARDSMGLGTYRTWPTGDDTYRRHARRLVDRIAEHRRALEALAGAPFERVFLGGSSAGAYFVAHLALRGDFPADGYAVLSGGSGRPAPRLGELPKSALYVGYGDGDIVGARAEEVAAQARAAGWKVRVAVHHTGHGSREVYLDEAFALFGVERP
jgi:predicted esterase